MTPSAIVRILQGHRIPLTDEIRVQDEIERILDRNEIGFQREAVVGNGDRIDFLIGDIGLEVKIKGSKRSILRQCQRYAGSPLIAGLILATAVATGFPETISDKPILLHSLGRAWL